MTLTLVSDSAAGWLCEPEDAPNESWMSDAYWVKANERHGHRYLIRHPAGISYLFEHMAWVRRDDFVGEIFYGAGADDPSKMTGLSVRYGTMDQGKAQNAVHVLDGGNAEGGSSLWVIAWGPRSIYMVTPDGFPPVAGGEAAVVVADWRFAVRVANVGADTELTGLVDRALFRLPTKLGGRREPGFDREHSFREVRPVIYAGPRDFDRLRAAAPDYGRPSRRNVPVRRIDALRSDEERVI